MTHYAKTGLENGVVWSIQTKKNNKVTAVVRDRKEEFLTWERAEVWVHKILESTKTR